jgi:hypothetical protein
MPWQGEQPSPLITQKLSESRPTGLAAALATLKSHFTVKTLKKMVTASSSVRRY